ncbi:MAG: glycoside hydrolase family 3 protein, partial [Mycobacterium sp.]|nr:glycoside hydrolase family 3 protein [Mycobacterium sp.]
MSALLAAMSALVVACGTAKPPAHSASSAGPAAKPVPRVCGDVTTLPTRDKLAQLLMVGVRDAD